MSTNKSLDDLINDLNELLEITKIVNKITNDQQDEINIVEESILESDIIIEETNIDLEVVKDIKKSKIKKVMIIVGGTVGGVIIGSLGMFLGPIVGVSTGLIGGTLGGTAAGIIATKILK